MLIYFKQIGKLEKYIRLIVFNYQFSDSPSEVLAKVNLYLY